MITTISYIRVYLITKTGEWLFESELVEANNFKQLVAAGIVKLKGKSYVRYL